MPIVLRQFDSGQRPSTLDAALRSQLDVLMQRAYRASSFLSQIEWYTTELPSAVVVANDDGGRIVGGGCCIAYPDAGFGWIGLIATDPDDQRRGIGRVITERAMEILGSHGCTPVLDASLAGGPLYERMGFHDAGVTTLLTPPAAASMPNTVPIAVSITVASGNDLDTITAIDRDAFGADRRPLMRTILAQNPGRVAIASDADGRPRGFVIARAETIGPLVADSTEVCRALIGFALALPSTAAIRIAVPPNSGHLDGLLQLGFTPLRELRHMRFGGDVPASNPAYVARASLGVG